MTQNEANAGLKSNEIASRFGIEREMTRIPFADKGANSRILTSHGHRLF